MEIDHDVIHAYNGLLSSNCTIKYNLIAVKKFGLLHMHALAACNLVIIVQLWTVVIDW